MYMDVKAKFSREISVTKMIQSLGWESLEARRMKMRTFLFKIMYGLVDIAADQLKPSNAHTRGHDKRFCQIHSWQNYYKFGFLPHAIEHWNRLPPDLNLKIIIIRIVH